MVKTVGKLLDEDKRLVIGEIELWVCDPVECISKLIGNPAFREYMSHVPEKTFIDKYG